MQTIDDSVAKEMLEEQDRIHGINGKDDTVTETIKESEPVTSLGKAPSYSPVQESAFGESPWKILNLNLLPSQGLFYPEDAELLIRSAKVKEIRHWSTIDESDPVDVREKINLILNSCTKFRVKGSNTPLNINDFLEVDRYHILFRIYELTFPNQENKLWAYIKCENPTCNHTNKTQVTSQNLAGFKYPSELMKWYSPADRCFVIRSEKLNDTFNLYLPNLGMSSKFRLKRRSEEKLGSEIDQAFYEYGPYLTRDWRREDLNSLTDIKFKSLNWHENKFVFIHKFTKQLEDASLNRAVCLCEKCKTVTESAIFLGGSFTVKDIFIISAGLDELI